MRSILLSLGLLVATGTVVRPLTAPAQEMVTQTTPFSVWLDFKRASRTDLPKVPLPIWIESFQSTPTAASEDAPAKTVFRLRLRRIGELTREVQLRLFFQDSSSTGPLITGWTETGTKVYSAPALGQGLGLPTTESVVIPAADLDYVEIEVPGNGSSIRGAFLTTLQKAEIRHSLDFDQTNKVEDAFGNGESAPLSKDDRYLFGRVRAPIEAGPVKLTPGETPRSTLEFELATRPLLAVVRFEVLNADPLHPLLGTINQLSLGKVSLRLPDLADPAYVGKVRPLENDMRFQYTGWIRCELVIPGSALVAGANQLVLDLDGQSGASGGVAFRNVELDLKYPSPALEYTLQPLTNP